MAQTTHVPTSPRSFALTALIILGVVVAVAAWYAASDDSTPSASTTVRESGPSEPAADVSRRSRVWAPDATTGVIIVARSLDQAREIRHHIAQDDFIADAFGGPRTHYTVESADSWVSEAELNELNAIRASLGELPIKAIYLD